jgi:hypothetical protein
LQSLPAALCGKWALRPETKIPLSPEKSAPGIVMFVAGARAHQGKTAAGDKSAILNRRVAVMNETFRLDLNQLWEAMDIKTGHAVFIPKGSHMAIRMRVKGPDDPREENYLVVTVQHKGSPVLAGLREAYWRQWEGHHIPELRITILEMKEKPRS